MSDGKCANGADEGGFAILLVLLLLAILSSIAAAFVSRVTTNTRATSYIAQELQAEALADASARLAALELVKLRNGQRSRLSFSW